MSITKKVINNNEYTFINSSRGNRSGFVHETKLYKNDRLIGENKVQYYNRTWESYTYQTVMKGAVRILLDDGFESFKANWKLQHDVKRLTKAKESEMMGDFATQKAESYAELQKLYLSL